MTSFSEAAATQAPLPDTLEEAQKEIQRLRMQLIMTNEKWAKNITLRELDRRSMSGTQDALREEIGNLRTEIDRLRQAQPLQSDPLDGPIVKLFRED